MLEQEGQDYSPAVVEQLVEERYSELPENDAAYQKLKRRITEHMLYLLQHDFEAAMQLLYRIDVSEAKAKAATHNKHMDEAAEALAVLIIERQMQKIETRKKYSSPNNHNPNDEYLKL